MTTPTQTRAVSTPKPHLPSTPSRMMASPRPGAGALAGKTLGKSPAMKTPASTHGHLHGLSVSSQPSSTPLGPIAIHDELLNMNSPAAALINSIAQNNLTPLPVVQDGLGMTAQTPLSARDGPKNPEAERLHNLQQAIALLKGKVAGRGITRTGIERVAKLHGFATFWDDCNLLIAGEREIVELEITFDKDGDTVRDLELKLNHDDGAQVQKAGTDILKQQVGLGIEATKDPAEDLCDFASNIEYLAELDRIVQTPNCFQLINNLSACLHDIWKEEKKRMHWRNDLHHLRKSAVGKPVMDRAPSLGLSIDIWQKELLDSKHAHGNDDKSSKPRSTSADLWSAKISCETGPPTVMSSKDWVASHILTEGRPGQNPLDAQDHVFHPDWRETAAGLAIKVNEPKDETVMDVDKKVTDMPQPLNVHFTFELSSEVLVPLPVLTRLNNEVNMIDIDPRKAVAYHQVLEQKRVGVPIQSMPTTSEQRWVRRVPYVDQSGKFSWPQQSYTLYSSSQEAELWCYPISKTKFNHPRQIAELLPILRMHIVVWALLQSIVKPGPESEAADETKNEKRKTFRRSNKPQPANGSVADSVLDVDVSIDYLSNPSKTAIEIYAPLKASSGPRKTLEMLNLVIQVGLNGVIEVSALTGVRGFDSTSIKPKVAKMLTAVEDIGIVIQWLQTKAEQ